MTGKRGRLTGTQYGMRPGPKPREDVAARPGAALAVVPAGDRPSLPVPAHLGPAGAAVWRAVFDGLAVVIKPDVDAATVQRLAELVDERDMFRAALVEHGALISEPIVTPRGDVVGERLVANPAEAMLRRADRALDSLAAQVGLSPQARARLGLAMSAAEVNAATAQQMLANLHRRKETA